MTKRIRRTRLKFPRMTPCTRRYQLVLRNKATHEVADYLEGTIRLEGVHDVLSSALKWDKLVAERGPVGVYLDVIAIES